MGSIPPAPGAAAAATAAAGGVPGQLGGSGTRAAAVRGTAASSSAERVTELDAREADAESAADLNRQGGRWRLSRLTPRRRGLPTHGRAVGQARPTGRLPPRRR